MAKKPDVQEVPTKERHETNPRLFDDPNAKTKAADKKKPISTEQRQANMRDRLRDANYYDVPELAAQKPAK